MPRDEPQTVVVSIVEKRVFRRLKVVFIWRLTTLFHYIATGWIRFGMLLRFVLKITDALILE